jgi:serine/threonine-protein kinase
MTSRPLSPLGPTPELIALQRVVAGRYSIVRELGRGGMGIVFLARDVALERPVAIKLLPPALAINAGYRARFVREARAAARLSHPNIVPIHSVEEHDDLAFFVMGFIDGETLSARVERGGPLRAADAIRLTQEVAWALAHAHGHGVIHRDVKPDNILLEGDTGRAIVTDFGIARVDGGLGASNPGAIIGTPRYMSPEQANGESVDGRSDLYALGAVAYFASTGRAPIDGDTAVAIFARKLMVTPTPLAVVRSDIPPRFAAAVDRCLERDPARRWPSAEDLLVAIRSAGGGTEIAAPIRAFMREADQVGSEVANAIGAGTVSAVLAILATEMPRRPGDLFGMSFVIVMYLAVTISMAGLAGIRVVQLLARARRLLDAGYGHSALRPALLGEAREQELDKRAAMSAKRTLAELGLGVAGSVGSFFLLGAPGDALQLLGFAGSIAIPTMVIRRAFESRRTQGGLWSRLLRGPVGRWMFRTASLGLGKRASMPAIGEPTSVALRQELATLFAALPGPQRTEFGALPELAERLERQAELLRDRTPHPETDRRLQSVVAVLEMLRLDLLRLTATDVDTGDLTRALDDARRLSEDIDARLEANEEVSRLLRQGSQRDTTA